MEGVQPVVMEYFEFEHQERPQEVALFDLQKSDHWNKTGNSF